MFAGPGLSDIASKIFSCSVRFCPSKVCPVPSLSSTNHLLSSPDTLNETALWAPLSVNRRNATFFCAVICIKIAIYDKWKLIPCRNLTKHVKILYSDPRVKPPDESWNVCPSPVWVGRVGGEVWIQLCTRSKCYHANHSSSNVRWRDRVGCDFARFRERERERQKMENEGGWNGW